MKVWVDVTGLYHWNGNFTGIQRIIFNVAKKITDSEMNSGLFVFHSGVYSEVSFEQLNNRLQQTKERDKDTKKHLLLNLEPSKINHYGFALLKKTVRGSVLDPQLRRTYKVLRKSYHNVKDLRSQVHLAGIFREDDVVLVIDGNWQLAGFAESIAKEHSKHKFYFIHMVQDLIAYNNPALVNKGANKIIGNYFKKVFESADALIAISESTKNDIEWFLKVNKIVNRPKIFKVTLGVNKEKISNSAPQSAKTLPKDFILSVSTIEIRKNYIAFYYIYNLAFQQGIELPHLVIVGRKGWMADETYTLLTGDPKINKSITIASFDDSELNWLYENCLYTVFPSFYEGWGLPVAESLAHGKCCISSNTSSMTEVGKEFATYVSPYDPASFLNEMIKLKDANHRASLEDSIRKKYEPQSWQQTFEQFKDIIEKAHE